jgi:hypothetical protein
MALGGPDCGAANVTPASNATMDVIARMSRVFMDTSTWRAKAYLAGHALVKETLPAKTGTVDVASQYA